MNLKDLGEFGLISKISDRFTIPEGVVGIGDDCAIIPQSEGKSTLVSSDMLIEDTHFLLEDIGPYRLGWKSAAVNISDIAAMGGRPIGTFLSIALPPKIIDTEWIDKFIEGYQAVSSRHNCPLLGGDTTRSEDRLCINVTIIGECTKDQAVMRSGAKDGDLICVTGNLGDSACGLKLIFDGVHEDPLIGKHYFPCPRVTEGQRLAMTAGVHSMMDISDGIGSDLRHILKASGVGAIVDINAIPISEDAKKTCRERGYDANMLAICGGEDYELLFTMDADTKVDIPYHVIGKIVKEHEGEIQWLGSKIDYLGFRHF